MTAQPEQPYEAPALHLIQEGEIADALTQVRRDLERAHAGLNIQVLLVQTVANLRAVKSTVDRLLEETDEVSIETLVRYINRPDPAGSGRVQLVDLNDFRAPTDLRGLEP